MDLGLNRKKGPDGVYLDIPDSPLYGMNREQLVQLRKELYDLLERGLIRVSNSPVGAPVLFVKKANGELRFCVDYRGLNSVLERDATPIPLWRETLRLLSEADWFTKIDIVAAFRNLRMREGDEWLTAMKTRFGLFEWLVSLFGVAGAPAAWQKFMNSSLKEFEDFVTAYLDDILIYTKGSLQEHQARVDEVLTKLASLNLQIDPEKCVFDSKSVLYLGMVIEAGAGVRPDPEKLAALRDWEPLTSV